jgi:hypothetical protein
MPPESTVRRWVVDDREGFAAQYARARDLGLDAFADATLELADTPLVCTKTKTKGKGEDKEVEVTTGDNVERARLSVEYRKWYMSKMAPKKYGDKLEIGGSITHKNFNKDVSEMSDEELDALIKGEGQ